MKITDIRVRGIRSPVYRPYTNSLGTRLTDTWNTSIIEVFTDEGITGTTASHGAAGLVNAIITDHLKPVVVGEDPMNYERLWRRMFGDEWGWRPPSTRGEAVRAVSIVDCAVWDIIGKALNTPVYRLLGGYRDQVPCYASGGHYISLADHRAEMDYIGLEMQRYMDMGFKAVKMRVGRDLATDLERIKLVREVIGSETRLLIDFNTSATRYGGVPHALKFMRALEEYNPFWFEDPLIMDDIAGMKQISDAIDTAIATGEREQTLWGFRDLVVNKAVDILIVDGADMCGGITEWRRIATLADAYRMPVAAHIGDVVHVHCVAAVPNGLIVEVFLPHDEEFRAYEVDPVKIPNREGMLEVPRKPGLGMELNEDYIQQHLV